MTTLLQRILKPDDAAIRKFRELRSHVQLAEKRINDLAKMVNEAEAVAEAARLKFIETMLDADLAEYVAARRKAADLREAIAASVGPLGNVRAAGIANTNQGAKVLHDALKVVRDRMEEGLRTFAAKQDADLLAMGLQPTNDSHPAFAQTRRQLEQLEQAICLLEDYDPEKSSFPPWSYAGLLADV